MASATMSVAFEVSLAEQLDRSDPADDWTNQGSAANSESETSSPSA